MKKIILILFTLSLSLLVTCADGLEEMFDKLGNKVPICVRSDAPDGGNGRGWATAYNNLQAAIDAVPAGSELWVAGEFIINASVTVNKPITFIGGFTGTETKLEERAPDSKTSVKGNISTSNCFTINSTDIKFDCFRFHDSSITSGCIFNIPETFSLNISNCVFENNNASSGALGGSVIRSSGSLSLADSKFLKNSSNNTGSVSGGAIQLASKSVTTINRCTFNENSVAAGTTSGGAISASSCTLKVYDSEFTNNYLTGSTALGGAICNLVSSVLIENTKFIGNHALAGGGAIYSTGSLIINNTSFEKNYATSSGGAIHFNGSSAGLTITGSSSFTGNYSTTGSAGAIYIIGSATTATISSVTFNGNYSYNNGGAINASGILSCKIDSGSSFKKNYTTSASASGGALSCFNLTTLAIADTTFSSNGDLAGGLINAKTGYGGAMYLDSVSDATIISATVDSNNASSNGGGIYLVSTGTCLISNSKISNNQTKTGGNGGGLCSEGCKMICNYVEFNGNTAKGSGGGIFIREYNYSYDIQGCKFINNTAEGSGGNGGAIYLEISQSMTVRNSLFYSNTADQGSAIYAYSGHTNYHNLTFYGNHSEINTPAYGATIYSLNATSPSIRNCAFSQNTTIVGYRDIYSKTPINIYNCFLYDPLVNSINITPTTSITNDSTNPFESIDIHNSRFLYPLAGGSLINKGDDSNLVDPFLSGSYDLVGNPRKVGSQVDIGAYEAQ